mmetsp:Transcript_8386/g.18191  ORF Transcript_8386/g.18191 Transcript_8386/m.18191 type:complete len:226 (+) Transcript_8386:617-1294(+)
MPGSSASTSVRTTEDDAAGAAAPALRCGERLSAHPETTPPGRRPGWVVATNAGARRTRWASSFAPLLRTSLRPRRGRAGAAPAPSCQFAEQSEQRIRDHHPARQSRKRGIRGIFGWRRSGEVAHSSNRKEGQQSRRSRHRCHAAPSKGGPLGGGSSKNGGLGYARISDRARVGSRPEARAGRPTTSFTAGCSSELGLKNISWISTLLCHGLVSALSTTFPLHVLS